MTKNYREYIGRLAQNGETGRGSVFINRLGIIQFNVKALMLPDAANSYVAGFGNLINDFTDDVYASVEDRIEHFEEFMENQLFIFRVHRIPYFYRRPSEPEPTEHPAYSEFRCRLCFCSAPGR